MRKRFLGFIVFLALVFPLALAQQTRRRPGSQQASPGDLKLKYRVTSAGQTMESTTMLKGARERSEMHTGYRMDTVSITQCDLKRIIQVSESAQKYFITPMVSGDVAAPTGEKISEASGQKRRGGVVNYTTTAVDTGERKEMLGFTARHVKSTLKIESSPEACSPVNQRLETDGWYIDLAFGLDCPMGRPQIMRHPAANVSCQDQVRMRREGTAKLGYPLSETTTMFGPDGKLVFTTTKEVIELSREPLDAALFEVPAGFTEAQSTQELCATQSMVDRVNRTDSPSAQTSAAGTSQAGEAKNTGSLRVGVVTINNKSGRPVSTESIRERLIGQIAGSGIEAIALNAISQMEAEAEARAKQCDFILFTDISTLKSSATKKLGGMLGRVAGVAGDAKTESRIDFSLFAVGETTPRLRSSVSAKEEGDEASAGTAIDSEAKMVNEAVRKKKD